MSKFMRLFSNKLVYVILGTILGLSIWGAQIANAQGEILFGQKHYYSVLFRGNGEAIVTARLELTNPNDQPLSEFSFQIPKANVSEVAMYQSEQSFPCLRYDYYAPNRPCLEYGAPDYRGGAYPQYGGNATYTKIDFTVVGNLYKFTLPSPVPPQKSTTVVLSYAAQGYTKNRFGLFSYAFETVKVPARIQNVQVAIDVDTELYLRGKRSNVEYARPASQTLSSEIGLGASAKITSPAFDSYVHSIGATGPVVKTAKALAPNESFIVKGEYARNWYRLYLSRIVTAVLILLVILAGLYFGRRYFHRPSPAGQEGTPSGGAITAALIKAQGSNMYVYAGWALLSAFLTAGLSIAIYVITQMLDRSYGYSHDPIFELATFLIIAILYILAIFGPALWVSSTHGVKSFLAVMAWELVWFLVLLLIYAVFFSGGTYPRSYPPDVMY